MPFDWPIKLFAVFVSVENAHRKGMGLYRTMDGCCVNSSENLTRNRNLTIIKSMTVAAQHHVLRKLEGRDQGR